MKKLIALVLALALCLSLAACGDDKGGSKSADSVAGRYYLINMIEAGTSYTPDDMADMYGLSEYEMYIDLNADGTAVLCEAGDGEKYTSDMGWGNGKIWPVEDPDDTASFSLSTDTLTLSNDDMKMVFVKGSKPADSVQSIIDTDDDIIVNTDDDIIVNTPTVDNSAVVAYANANRDAFLASMEESFSATSGMTCTSDLQVVGMGFVVTVNINEFDNIDAATKAALQESYDSMSSAFEASLEMMQTELPALEYVEYRICEVDGDLLATVLSGNK